MYDRLACEFTKHTNDDGALVNVDQRVRNEDTEDTSNTQQFERLRVRFVDSTIWPDSSILIEPPPPPPAEAINCLCLLAVCFVLDYKRKSTNLRKLSNAVDAFRLSQNSLELYRGSLRDSFGLLQDLFGRLRFILIVSITLEQFIQSPSKPYNSFHSVTTQSNRFETH